MIEIIKELSIEVSKPNIFQAVVAKQYDMNTRFIKATLVDGADVIYIPKDIDGSVKVVINAERPDGQSKGFDGSVNEDGTVTVPLHSWMLELEGTVICDISIIDTEADDNKKLTTTAFTLLVEKAAYGGTDVTNDPQYDVLVQLLETCSTASTVAQEALDKSNEANAKYDACVEATEDARAVRQEVEEGGFIESLKEMNNGGKFSVWVGTTAEYNALSEKADNCFYILTDDTMAEDIDKKIAEHGETLTQHGEILTEQVDYIVEQDTSPFTCSDGSGNEATGHWYYRKWKSGIAECWFNEIIMFNAENIGNLGIADVDGEDLVFIYKNFTLPITFAKDISATCSCGWKYTEWAQCHAGTTSTVMVRIFCRAKSLEHLISKGLSISLQIKGNTK